MDRGPGEQPPADREARRGILARMLVLALLLAAAWVLWSGFFKPLLLGLGALSTLMTLYIVRRMGYFDNETFALDYGPSLLAYWWWLGGEVIKSALEVARVVLQPRVEVEPQVIEIDASELDLVDQALLGNSITLTPGTLTLDVYQGRIRVHALTAGCAASVEDGEMQRRVAALGGR